MRARILDQRAIVYSEPDASSPPVTQASPGEEVELGGVKKKGGQSWVAVKLARGERGYLEGNVKIYHIKPVSLLSDQVEVHADPSATSMVKSRLRRKARLLLVDTVNNEGKAWVKVRDDSGTEGFLDGGTRIKRIAEITKAVGRKNMLYGALWCVGGTVVTAVTLSMASSGGTYVVAWGAILFGGIQFFKGLYQFVNAPL
jgi:hypothetical protein